MQGTVLPLSSRYREAISFTLIQQIPCALLSLLILDGGGIARICGITMLGYWASVALMMVRRPLSPNSIDIMLLRWGFFPLYGLVAVLAVALNHFD